MIVLWQYKNTVPAAPAIGTALPGNLATNAIVSFTAPANTGGRAITGYTVTSTPGNVTASGASSPITIGGLTADLTYTFSVHATNAVGNSAESSASNQMIPAATVVTPAMDRFEQVATDGEIDTDLGINNWDAWGYHQPQLTHHADGKIRMIYSYPHAGVDAFRVKVRAVGGGWSEDKVADKYDDVFLLRDQVTDKAIIVASTPHGDRTVYVFPSYTGSRIPGNHWRIPADNGNRIYGGVGIGSDGTLIIKEDVDLYEKHNAATLLVYENATQLWPPHAYNPTIQGTGLGNYCYDDDTVRYSATDNSDPTTNGRTYTYKQNYSDANPVTISGAIKGTGFEAHKNIGYLSNTDSDLTNSGTETLDTQTHYISGNCDSGGNWTWQTKVEKGVGLRHAYDYIFPGAKTGKFIGLSVYDTTKAVAGWPNCPNSYIFDGVTRYESSYGSDTFSSNDIIAPLPDSATAGEPIQRPDNQYIDSQNRIWTCTERADPNNGGYAGHYITVSDLNGNVLLDQKWSLSAFGHTQIFEAMDGHLWLIWANEGGSYTQFSVYPITVGFGPFSATLGTEVDLHAAIGTNRIRTSGHVNLAHPRGGNIRTNFIEGKMTCYTSQYPAAGSGANLIFYFRVKVPLT
jgi:hypothetical protein